MICPIRMQGYVTSVATESGMAECLREGCAWYDDELDCCAIKTIAIEIDSVKNTGRELIDHLRTL